VGNERQRRKSPRKGKNTLYNNNQRFGQKKWCRREEIPNLIGAEEKRKPGFEEVGLGRKGRFQRPQN